MTLVREWCAKSKVIEW